MDIDLTKVKNLAKQYNLIPIVPITNNQNKPYCTWSNEEYWIKSVDEIKNKIFHWVNRKGETKKGKITGFGLLTGARSGITIIDLDVDHKHGVNGVENFQEIISRLPEEDKKIIESTFIVETPRGGKHLYFKYVEGIKNEANIVEGYPGIDARNDGGQAPIPYSQRKIDNKILEYKILNNNDIHQMPQSLINKLKNNITQKLDKFELMDEDIFLPLKGMVDGDGRNVALNEKLFLYAKQHNLTDFISIKAIAKMVNEIYFAEEESGWEATAESVYRKIRFDVEEKRRDIKVFDFIDSLKSSPIEKPSFLVHRLIYDKGINLLVGDPKTFKTYIALDIALGVITGTTTLGHEVFKKGKVLLMSTELDVRDRIINLINGRKLELDIFKDNLFMFDYNSSLDSFEWNKDKNIFEDMIVKFKPDLVILDPISYIFDGEITDNDEVKQFFRELKEMINKYNFSVILTHHNNRMKNTNRNGKISGAAAFSRHSDSVIHLEKFDEDEKQDINKSDEELDHEVKPIKLIKGDYRFGLTGYRYYLVNLNFRDTSTIITATKLEIDETTIKNKKESETARKATREEDILKRLIEKCKKGLFRPEGMRKSEIAILINNTYGVTDSTYHKDITKVLNILEKDGYIEKGNSYKYYLTNENIEYPFI
ncbi:AAA family ATPase [Clostridium cadaveris]|uniref:AAA family ATPase n=1 Tax=Clostridium cadaveris TaxID=1529 RepID=UPI0031DA6B18